MADRRRFGSVFRWRLPLRKWRLPLRRREGLRRRARGRRWLLRLLRRNVGSVAGSRAELRRADGRLPSGHGSCTDGGQHQRGPERPDEERPGQGVVQLFGRELAGLVAGAADGSTDRVIGDKAVDAESSEGQRQE